MKISPARSAAFDILLKIERDKSFSSVLLPLYEAELSPADRRLCHELVLGVLRRKLYLDRIIEQVAANRTLDAEVRLALRIGIYQLIYLDRIPAYSAVSDSVELTVRAKKSSAKGLVNALLRRMSREVPRLEYRDEVDRLSVETSHPRWLVEKWCRAWGFDDVARLCEANDRPPPLALRITPRGQDVVSVDAYASSQNVPGCRFAPAMTGDLLELAASGCIYFQDEASQLIASAVTVREGEWFLDVCAAPGGKTTAIGGRYRADGAVTDSRVLFAGDKHARRVIQLQETCELQGVGHVNIAQYDAEKALPFADESFDVILVDAPCSGTGTIRHNPEIRYFLRPEDFDLLKQTQLAILKNVSKLLRPNGKLVYSTCSLESEENEDVCRAFLEASPSFRVVRPKVADRFLTENGYARTFPHRDDMDGFFAAEFIREN